MFDRHNGELLAVLATPHTIDIRAVMWLPSLSSGPSASYPRLVTAGHDGKTCIWEFGPMVRAGNGEGLDEKSRENQGLGGDSGERSMMSKGKDFLARMGRGRS